MVRAVSRFNETLIDPRFDVQVASPRNVTPKSMFMLTTSKQTVRVRFPTRSWVIHLPPFPFFYLLILFHIFFLSPLRPRNDITPARTVTLLVDSRRRHESR